MNMIYWGLLVAELLTLFITSRYIFQAVFHLCRKIFKKDNLAIVPIFILFLPGTVIHELAHFITAELLMVKAYDLEVAPRIHNGYLQMGSVQVAQSDILRRMLIGVAPIIVGIIVLFAALSFYTSSIGIGQMFATPVNAVLTVLVLWMCFFIPNTMFSSKKDLEGVVEFLVAAGFVVFVAGLILYFLKINAISLVASALSISWLVDQVRVVVFLLLIPVIFNAVIFLLANLIIRRARH
jgi:hypothetical protein